MQSPIFRIGCLVSAYDGGKVRTFSYRDGERAVELLNSFRAAFGDRIRDAVLNALKSCGGGQLDVPLPIDMKMRPARRSHSLGIVYDFDEFSLSLRGQPVVARGCVTVCVGATTAKSAEGVDKDSPESHSKFWARFMIVQPDKNYSVEEIRQFEKDCRVLGEAMIQSLVEPYRDVLRELAEAPTLEVACEADKYRIVAVDASSDDFDNLFIATRDGEKLGDQLRKSKSADFLAQLGLAVIADRDKADLDSYSQLIDAKTEFDIYDPADFYRGLTLTNRTVEGEHSSVVVGITQGPNFNKIEPDQKLRMGSSNVVSVRLISSWGMRR